MQLPFVSPVAAPTPSTARRPSGRQRPTLLELVSQYWVHGFTTLQLLIAVLGVLHYGSPGAYAYACISLHYTILAWLVSIAQARGNSRFQPNLILLGSLVGAVLFVLVSPHFLTTAMLSIINMLVHVISLPNIDARKVRSVGVCAVIAVGLLLVLATWNRFAGPLLELRLLTYVVPDVQRLLLRSNSSIRPEQVSLLVEGLFRSIWTFGFIANIVHLLWRFHGRILNNVSSLRKTNTELAVAQRTLEQRLHERTQLLEVTRAIASTQDFPSLLRSALVQLRTVVDYGRATALLLNNDKLEELSSIGHLPQISPVLIPQLMQHAFQLDSLMQLREPMLLPEPSAYKLDGSHMFIPLIVRGRFIGILTIRHAVFGFYTQHDADLCMAYANQVAGMIAAAQMQKAAASALVVAERSRLARELHDSVSQSLFGIVLGTRTALEQIESSPEAARSALLYSVDLAAAALAEMRALIFTMRPETLEQHGLVVALRNQVDLLQPQHDILIAVIADAEPVVTLDVKEAFYRIAVEALQNALRHSQCTQLTMRIDADAARVRLEVHDNGQGFDPNASYSGHLGLKSMHERAAAIGAELRIASCSDGTCVSVTLPAPARA